MLSASYRRTFDLSLDTMRYIKLIWNWKSLELEKFVRFSTVLWNIWPCFKIRVEVFAKGG